MKRCFVALACFLFAFTAASAGTQLKEEAAPTTVPFTAEPRQLQWRIGFDLGNALILETPELNPENDTALAVREAERVLPAPFLDLGLALLPVPKVSVRDQQLVNPRQWTILDLIGKTNRRTFQALGVFMGRRMVSAEGGYHLVSLPEMALTPFLGVRRQPSPNDLIFGFAGPIKGKLEIRGKLSETKWENLLPVEDPAHLPVGYLSAKQLLDDQISDDAQQRFIYGTSIEALIRNRLSKLWLLNYSHPDTTIGKHPWGIFIEEGPELRPLYIYSATGSDDPYVAYFTASVDLDRDGTDELVVEASYRIGTAYKVITSSGGKYREIFTSYYRGPN
jgi:hypothetical protein